MYTLPSTLEQEISEYGRLINQFRSGNVEPVKFKGIRVPMGIYEQREDDTYMVRVRCAGGFITPARLKQVARIAREHKAGYIHITTRQELQIQHVTLENTQKILGGLYETGLSSRGGGGNTVRNIMASVDSGIADGEAFDVLPYAVALTNKLISEPDSWTLPRKFKISFSSSDSDNAYAAFNDLGFIAKIRDGKKGFKVFIGGSLGVKPMVGHVLFEFAPVEDLLYIADAAKKLFSRYGNRRNRHKARLRFVFYKLGKEKVFEYFREIFNEIKNSTNLELVLKTDSPGLAAPTLAQINTDTTEYKIWKERYVKLQRQQGLYSVEVPVNKGNLSHDKCEVLARFLENFGDDVLRLSMKQNIHLRNIPREYLGTLYQFLNQHGFEINKAQILNSMVSCTGADTCRLGVCLSKGVLEKLKAELEKSGLDLDNLKDLKINISGCPNSCGQQSASDLGFYGKVGRTDRIYPSYMIVAAARTGDNMSRLAVPVDEISARDMPRFTLKFLELYLSKKGKYSSFSEYFDNEGENDIHKICDNFREVPAFDDDKNYYFDWGAENIFSVTGRGDGQCSAGLFDMIDFDFNNIKKYKEALQKSGDKNEINELLYQIIFSASRMLLITRGFEPKNTREVFDGFIEKFINAGLVDKGFENIVQLAGNNDNIVDYTNHRDAIFELAGSVIELYENMDDSLQFNIPEKPVDEKEVIHPDMKLKKDYRGVTCPMNFVKTKIDLATLKSGELMEVLLDDGEPIDNVPGSVQSEGHKIKKQTKIDNYWSVIIEKG